MKRWIKATSEHASQCSFDFLHDGYYSNYSLEIICTVACEAAGVEFVASDCYSVDYSMYPEYADRYEDISQCSFDFTWTGDYDDGVISSVLENKLAEYDYELLGISFTSLD